VKNSFRLKTYLQPI